jgi:GNAT superfamily N-acetyltransferase
VIRIERRNDPQAAERLLRALPSWFGIESAIKQYVRDAAVKPSYLAQLGDDTIGVALIERHYPEAAELYLIAVLPHHHRAGVGSALLNAIEADLEDDGVQVLQVKTLGEASDHQGYAATRAFYRARGYSRLEEVTNFGWSGPTLIMVKSLA